MNNSKNSSNTSQSEPKQLPLPGQHIVVESDKAGWQKTLVGMPNGRFLTKMTKIRK